MKSKQTRLHRGQILSAAVKNSNYTREKAASRAKYSRSSYYKHISDADLDFHILIKYGKAIGHDFTEEFPDMPKYVVEDPEANYNKTPTLEEMTRQRDYWKDKYLELLEKYNQLIEEMIKKK